MKVLFVFHHAGITGAALLLYSTVEWLSSNTDIKMSFLLRDDGPLKSELARYGNVYDWNSELPKQTRLLSRIRRKLFSSKTPQDLLIDRLENEKFDIVYFNTILCSSIIEKLAHFKAKKIWHIHELELAIKTHGTAHLEAKNSIDQVIANSNSTKKNLVNHGFTSSNIHVIYPFIDLEKIKNKAQEFSGKNVLNLPEDAFIIGTSGTAIDTKGVQNFLTLPSILDHLMPGNTCYFVWVGTCPHKQKIIVDYDIAKSGNSSRIIFTGEQRNPYPYYKSFNVFVSTSKEESFGLSVIEAAALNKPVMCFKNTGGVEEIVAGSGNVTVDYMDLYQMALELIALYKNRNLMNDLGDKAYAYAKEYDTNIIMPDMLAFLNNTLKV